MKSLDELRALAEEAVKLNPHNENKLFTAQEMMLVFKENDKLLGLIALTAELQHSCDICGKGMRR